jgi:chromosome partitioning protein
MICRPTAETVGNWNRTMRTIAFATQKGGSGKSTLAIGVAVAALEAGERVFMLEADRQGTVSKWGARRSNPNPGIDHIAGGIALERALKLLAGERYSLAIIDTPGTDNISATAAIRAAELCLIPARPSPADIEAAHPTIQSARRLGKNFAFVLNQAPARSFRLSEAERALNRMGVLALPYIVQRMDHQDALGVGLGVSEFNPDGKAAEEIRALWTWIKGKLESREDTYDQNLIAAAR